MSSVIKSPKDFWTGVLYISFGAIAFWIARDYPFGTARQMGAGYFPSVLSCLLIFFGILALLRGLLKPGASLGRFAWKQAFFIIFSTLAFAFLLPRAGLLVALVVLIVGSALASKKTRFDPKSVLIVSGLVVFCVLVFVKGLGLPLQLLGSWFGG